MLILTFVGSSENYSFILSCLVCFNSESKEELIYFKQIKLHGKRRGQLGQEASRDSTLQSILPNVCPICFIYSLHFSVTV